MNCRKQNSKIGVHYSPKGASFINSSNIMLRKNAYHRMSSPQHLKSEWINARNMTRNALSVQTKPNKIIQTHSTKKRNIFTNRACHTCSLNSMYRILKSYIDDRGTISKTVVDFLKCFKIPLTVVESLWDNGKP